MYITHQEGIDNLLQNLHTNFLKFYLPLNVVDLADLSQWFEIQWHVLKHLKAQLPTTVKVKRMIRVEASTYMVVNY